MNLIKHYHLLPLAIKESSVVSKGQKEILSINEMIYKLSHQNDMKITYNNGFHVNYAITSIDRVSVE